MTSIDTGVILKKVEQMLSAWQTMESSLTFLSIESENEWYNSWADYWRYVIGVDPILANTRNKTPLVHWTEFQNDDVPEELHIQWKEEGKFRNGLAIILGKIRRGKYSGYYLNLIDADNRKALDEIRSRDGKMISMQDLAKWTIVEQHRDNPDRAHIFILSTRPFVKKSSCPADNNKFQKISSDAIPVIEVKGQSDALAYVTPSIHKNGHFYQILGTLLPIISDEFEEHIDKIYKKYGIPYLDSEEKNSRKTLIPIEELAKSEFRIIEGNNRHEALMRYAESLMARNKRILSLDQIRSLVVQWNNRCCVPPLEEAELEKQWQCALDFVDKNRDGRSGATNEPIAQTNEEELINYKLGSDKIEFVLDTIKKEAPFDEVSIKQLFYGMCSAFTKIPIPHNINSKDPGAGKSYLLILVVGYFPSKYVIVLSGMSDKAIFHREGMMVIEDRETGQVQPISPILKELKNQIKEPETFIAIEKAKEPKLRNKIFIKEYEEKIESIEDQMKEISKNAEKLIDLNNQIILCLDTPQDSLFDTLMSLMSQDTPNDQKYSFVEKSGSGKLGTKNNRLRGMPVLFTTQVIDDTRRERFQEKNRRFIHVTPDTSDKKIQQAKMLIGYRYGTLEEEYDEACSKQTR